MNREYNLKFPTKNIFFFKYLPSFESVPCCDVKVVTFGNLEVLQKNNSHGLGQSGAE